MTYPSLILAAAKAAKVSGALLLAICTLESGLTNAVFLHDGNSPTYGVCQIKFETAKMLGYDGVAQGLMEPETNAYWAGKYLAYQLDRYDDNWCLAVAAYNAGSFNESQKFPGYPRNLKYVRNVQKKLPIELRSSMECLK